MSNKVKNPMKVITGPNTRWSYCNVWQPKSINGGTPQVQCQPDHPQVGYGHHQQDQSGYRGCL